MPLGEYTDVVIANTLGLSQESVRKQRLKRNIPAHRPRHGKYASELVLYVLERCHFPKSAVEIWRRVAELDDRLEDISLRTIYRQLKVLIRDHRIERTEDGYRRRKVRYA